MAWGYCARVGLVLFALGLLSVARAATQITDATITEVTERGFVLTVGTEPLVADDESATRFWRDRKPAKKEDFKKGDAVKVRLKTDAATPVVREIADRKTWDWLEKIRKEPTSGTVKRVDANSVTLKLEDGSEFTYRATEKSDVQIEGKPVPATDLKEGQKVYAKGRTLPSLDTWLVQLTDKPITVAKKGERKSTSKKKAPKLAQNGTLRGPILSVLLPYRMFDLDWEGTRLHITFDNATKFTQGGESVAPSTLKQGDVASVRYRRDTFGRIIATKVELFVGPRA